MQKSNMVEGLPHIIPSKVVCNGCVSKIMHRESFPHGTSWRASQKFHLIRSDLLRPMENISVQGSNYALSFVDDFTRRIWINFLHSKDQVLDTFVEYHIYLERQHRFVIFMMTMCIYVQKSNI